MTTNSNEPTIADAAIDAFGMSVKLGEIAIASAFVIGARMMLIGAAMRNPVAGDYRELGRMVPEKVTALAQSGAALMSQMGAVQRDMAAHIADSNVLLSGGITTPAIWMKLATEAGHRGTRAVLWPFATGDAAIAPVYRAVTSNARRLGPGKARRKG